MKYYIRHPLRGRIHGPYELDEIRVRMTTHEFTHDWFVAPYRGQNVMDVEKEDWKVLADVLGLPAGQVEGQQSSAASKPVMLMATDTGGSGAATALAVVAFLQGIGGVLGGGWIINNLGVRPVPGYTYVTQQDPLMIALGVAVIVEGIVGAIVFWAFSNLVRNVAEISSHLRQSR